jgi:hypothetical protein
MPSNREKFYFLLYQAHNVEFNLEMIKKKNKKKEEDKKIVMQAIHIFINNKDLVKAAEIMFCKNPIIKMIGTHLFKVYIKTFSNNISDIKTEDDPPDIFDFI